MFDGTTVKSKMTRGEREGLEFGGTGEGEIGRKGLKRFALDARLSAQSLVLQASLLAWFGLKWFFPFLYKNEYKKCR